MIYDHWICDDDGSSTLVLAEPERPAESVIGKNARYCCRIESDSCEDVMRKFHDHLGVGTITMVDPKTFGTQPV